jgi:hypothetical protein
MLNSTMTCGLDMKLPDLRVSVAHEASTHRRVGGALANSVQPNARRMRRAPFRRLVVFEVLLVTSTSHLLIHCPISFFAPSWDLIVAASSKFAVAAA